jgi:cytochrome c oxidase accessory protein FixG
LTARRLPLISEADDVTSSLASDGRRRFVYPADVRGRFVRIRKLGFVVLIAMWLALPLTRIGGHPAVFLDVAHRRFFLLGASFNAQDVWLTFFVLTAIGYLLALVTSLLGRAWCGYACPQTVFLEGVFRPIERLIEGSRDKRMRRDRGPWSFDKAWRKILKHSLYLVASAFVAHVLISFFVSVPELAAMVIAEPARHPQAFAWALGITLVTYGNFAWFREQVCVIVCPYGRMQSILLDPDSLVIGYDEKRGEPRGKLATSGAGDCVDCRRCVVVCPTGIDIRNGLQLDCIACAQCVDACDEVMVKLGRAPGLVRYDSQRGLAGEARRIARPRLIVYAVLGLMGLVVASVALSRRTEFEVSLLREAGAPFVVEGDTIRNSFTLHLVNKQDDPLEVVLAPEGDSVLTFVIAATDVSVDAMGARRVNVVVTAPKGSADKSFRIGVRRPSEGPVVWAKGKFVGPG